MALRRRVSQMMGVTGAVASMQDAVAVAVTKQDVDAKSAKLAELKYQIEAMEKETTEIEKTFEGTSKESEALEAENRKLQAEIKTVEEDTVRIREQVAPTSQEAENVMKQRAELVQKLAQREVDVKIKLQQAEVAAGLAQKTIIALQESQEAERQKWQALLGFHENAKKEIQEKMKQGAEAWEQHQTEKVALAVAREEQQQLQRDTKRLAEEHKVLRASLQEQDSIKQGLLQEIAAMEAKKLKLAEEREAVEADARQRRQHLALVQETLQNKQTELKKQLEDFQEKMDFAQSQHEKVLDDHSKAATALSQLMEEQLEMHADRAAKDRELAQLLLEENLLQWEHGKVAHDLRLLVQTHQDPALVSLVGSNPS